jgi:hypothetical protein
MAHARRKFHQSRRLDPPRMETALAWIGKLYAIEKDLRQRCQGEWKQITLEDRAERIVARRQERSRPLLDGFHAWLDAEAPKVLPKSAVRGAMDYTLNNWAALSVYPNDGWLDIDNNEGENSIRGLCLGRRNWLFMGSERGGRAAAIHFSLLASCKRHGHDPWVYYRDVLTRLPAMLPGATEEELLALPPTAGVLPDLLRPPSPRRAGDLPDVFRRTLTIISHGIWNSPSAIQRCHLIRLYPPSYFFFGSSR